jgi:anti-sigma-K factor RskA
MTHDEHAPFLENIPAYSLGALDAEESAALETHLETCASCRTELAEYRALSQFLLTAAPPHQPSAALRKRLQNRLPSAQRPSRLQWNFSFSRLAIGLGVLALLALNLASFMQVRQIQAQQASLLNQLTDAQAALALLSSPSLQLVAIDGDDISGSLLLDKQNNQAVLIVQNLPALAEDQIYQIWLIEPDEGRVSAGLFRPDSGGTYIAKVLSSTQPLTNYLGIGVTIEPAGGSDAPTGKRVLKVDF